MESPRLDLLLTQLLADTVCVGHGVQGAGGQGTSLHLPEKQLAESPCPLAALRDPPLP